MKKLLIAVLLVAVLVMAMSWAVFADKPNDNHGADCSVAAKDAGNNKDCATTNLANMPEKSQKPGKKTGQQPEPSTSICPECGGSNECPTTECFFCGAPLACS